jgi:hypothetical protein
MKKFEFTVMREMHGDREYAAGDTREMTAADAVGLVRAGALEPKGKEAKAAMEEIAGDAETWGVRPVRSSSAAAGDQLLNPDDPNAIVEPVTGKDAGAAAENKDAGNAAANKDAGNAAANKAAGTVTARPAATTGTRSGGKRSSGRRR